MKFQKEFREEYFAKIKADGYELNGQMFIGMEKELYIEWLETKLQNTSSNSEYKQCQACTSDVCPVPKSICPMLEK